MSDRSHRHAERYDPVAALAWRLRFGEIDRERVAYAAALGHPVALQVVEPAELPADPRERTEPGVRLLSHVEAVRWAADLAAVVVRAATHGDDLRPANAIAAARAWADCPCEEHRQAATQAATEAVELAEAAWAARDAAAAEAAAWTAAAATAVPAMREASAAWASAAAVRSGVVNWHEVFADLANRLLA